MQAHKNVVENVVGLRVVLKLLESLNMAFVDAAIFVGGERDIGPNTRCPFVDRIFDLRKNISKGRGGEGVSHTTVRTRARACFGNGLKYSG
jgi:hypothetical protein